MASCSPTRRNSPRDLEITNVAKSSFDENWTQPWGEWRTIRNRYNEMRVTLREVNKLHRSLTVVFRVYDNGVGFRYEFPDAWKSVNIAEELTQFSVAEPATAWWSPAFESNREEQLYNNDSDRRDRDRADPADAQDRERAAHRDPRSGVGRLMPG